jgi:GH15 family glucan-1,4-alpha-glucosidase
VSQQTLNLAVIGNCQISALIDTVGRIVWACLPRHDGDPVFCSLLGGDARDLFEHMLERRTPQGLLSEDLDPQTGELWGNYPQSYSVVGIINSAMRLSRTWEDAL